MITQGQIAAVLDHPVYDVDGNKIGDTKHVSLDDATGEPEWVSIKTGLFGTSESFVPTREATMVDDHLEVSYAKATVKDAPMSTSTPGASSRWTRNTVSTSTTASRGTKAEVGSRSPTRLTREDEPAPIHGQSLMSQKEPRCPTATPPLRGSPATPKRLPTPSLPAPMVPKTVRAR
ncbi:PRC-barrel domain-containing protein [Streptomyces sp. NPDC002599]|uniref:PRC-barrel domain-containing protein n=1 Tax=Streptomyces sp. NPDC002599 TaxID=3154421 RepID=UPI00333081F6